MAVHGGVERAWVQILSTRKKPALTPRAKKVRHAMAQGNQHRGFNEWERVIACDEFRIDTNPAVLNERVLRRPGEEYHPDCVHDERFSGREGVSFWGAFCGEHHTPLLEIPLGVKMDSAGYVTEILEPHLWPFYVMTERYGEVALLEDNAPGHMKFATKWRIRNGINTVAHSPASPDLNYSENIWSPAKADFTRQFCLRTGPSRVQRWEVVEWAHERYDQIANPELLIKLVESMPRRIQAVIDVEVHTYCTETMVDDGSP
ncbi:hypothetical protein P152DRAFT_517346 [Eremomyces bilateralis CBS 781.70]|uniref:Tc1-like transposase DDE domain-containing protein n=1 Tax=Eremomyces bilateralis CBS 781.70 TaxID=1392243 RepID=A0A6G1FSF5_9PEZI|nr:uncharacterized protein P152DRAFT_517346 [Eremomyces bilateralis CBS 781.70]KAF1808714.1 hypothetical protein P152DRAFT_517346 [Eremomyces bilateralis CBS 781.70]